MSDESTNLLLNPLFRYGVSAMSAAVLVVVALFVIDDQLVRYVVLAVAASELVVTPQILKLAGEQSETETETTDLDY